MYSNQITTKATNIRKSMFYYYQNWTLQSPRFIDGNIYIRDKTDKLEVTFYTQFASVLVFSKTTKKKKHVHTCYVLLTLINELKADLDISGHSAPIVSSRTIFSGLHNDYATDIISQRCYNKVLTDCLRKHCLFTKF